MLPLSWKGNVEMWLESLEDVKVIQIQNCHGIRMDLKKKKNYAPQTLNVKSL